MLYRFADCALDTQLYTLHRAGQSTRLPPKVFEVLCYLIAHRDRVVSKQELCEQVWEGLAISDATLESCLRAVRLTVGDSGQAQRIIQTQRGYGYRFVAELAILPDETSIPPVPPEAVSLPLTPPPVSPGMRPCAACQHANREDTAFCEACGTRLRQPCAHCGQAILLPAAFCPACGQSLVAPSLPGPVAPLAPAPTLSPAFVTPPDQRGFGAERKLVTVLCGTVASPAAGGARFDLDTLYSVMQELHALALDVAHPYGGRLHSLMGDRLLILFGVPAAHEDDARRAVRVALALHRRFQMHQERLEAVCRAPLAFRIGLHTGLAVVGGAADDAELSAVVGDVVSVAMLLQEQATPGELLCSDTTARLIQGMAHLKALAPVQLPGQPTPMMLYAILGGPDRRAPGWDRWERELSPFVGRERELATLHALLAQVETGRGQVVGVVGEPGIGKSRLLYEFRQSLAGQRLMYLAGRCLSYGSTTPYLPVLDILRHNCGITETDRPEEITAKVHYALQDVEMAPAEWAPVLLHLLGVPAETDTVTALDPETRKARTLMAVTQMCLHGSRPQPLILEIEDLHWIDASSDECLTALVERMAGAALLVLVTYRPGYRPTWVDKSYATLVSLQPLTQPDSLRVVQAVLPAGAQTTLLVPQLLAKAEGNPFFLEELARTVVEQGADASSTTVPDTVQAVLTARMDRLPATAKHLLQAAAVIGKDVAVPLLQAVTEVPEEALDRDIRYLQAAEFLYETYAPIAPVYTFKHVLTQEVAYHSLVRRERQRYHAHIAQVLEAQFPEVAEAQPELLAYHYTEAGRGAQAVPYWQRAGQRAVERSANVEAISHFTKGLEVLQGLPDTLERAQRELVLQLALAPPLRMTKGETAPETEGVYTRAYELSQRVGDRLQLFSALLSLSRLYLNRASIEKARELAEQCFSLAQSVQDPVLLQEGHQRLGSTLFFHGELVSARMHFERGIALYYAQQGRLRAFSGGMDPGVTCLCYLAWTLWLLGYPEQALQRSCEALTLARESSYAYSLTVALHYAAVLRLARREARLAQALAEETIELSRRHRFAQWEALGIFMRGGALVEQGLIEEGLDQLRQAQAASRAMGKELAQTHFFVRLAKAYLQGKRVEEGLQVLTEALHFIHDSGEHYLAAEVYRLKGALLLQQHIKSPGALAPSQPASTLAEAENAFRHALAVARLQQAKSLELRAARSLSRLWRQQGRRAEADALLAQVYGWFTEGFDTADLQEAKALLEELRG
jgi:class 3 adenylate cyclase/DNA-binding winged helix-turn-helix (wHTH) protein/predicted ATPase